MNRLISCIIDLLHRPFVKKGVDDPYHEVFRYFQHLAADRRDVAILEIGSRNVTGITRRRCFPDAPDYTGFDIHVGEGVDIVGDVHCLSRYFERDRFDFVFSASVFEHLLFPWKAILEINDVMKTGGYVYLSTHPVWPAHELPWDFWRFPENGFRALFNTFTGFEIVSLKEGLPAKIYSLVDDLPTRGVRLHTVNQGVAVVARKTGSYRRDLCRWDVELADVLEDSYPKP